MKLLLLAATVPSVYAIGSFFRKRGSDPSTKNRNPARIQKYKTLGRTGLRVSDIGFGVSVSTDPQLLVDAYHRGINYFDISPNYSWSVEMLAAAFARDAEMKKGTIVASKVECKDMMDNFRCFSQIEGTRKEFLEACVRCIDNTLKELDREYIDILQLHAVGQRGETDLGACRNTPGKPDFPRSNFADGKV